MNMKYSLDDKEKRIIEKAMACTQIDYELKDNDILVNDFLNVIEDLIYEIEHLNEQIRDIKQDIEDNYRKIAIEEQL